MKTQKIQVLETLQSGNSITPLEALKEFGCFRLASVIHSLRGEGHRIKTTMVSSETKAKLRYARYTMEMEPF